LINFGRFTKLKGRNVVAGKNFVGIEIERCFHTRFVFLSNRSADRFIAFVRARDLRYDESLADCHQFFRNLPRPWRFQRYYSAKRNGY
jgi:hypothetical protein